ncbi:YbjQ family protein [Arthrobacter sp. FW306-2-2C-D06B]|uniref:YbjQ family protein n=1 Tax=Arthrobacter sp. FW306-2-2C-D06B TaxID=2879618 RepID=UPI001F3039B8|nr:YbjQ family protein [Arthrobacter sp. FW306-2-2C-D06B]UKA60037.1 YbjQ family protein [Arthrobacter sp. FW306-2-2C-D06B]
MLIVTSNKIPGHRIDAVFGEVMGLTVRSRDLGSQMIAGFRSLGGGELPEMTKALYESRQEVMARMVNEAQQRGANAIVAMRFDTSEMGGNWTEVCAYGTAVFAIPLAEGEPGATGQSIYLTSVTAQQSEQPTTSAAPQEHAAPPEI